VTARLRSTRIRCSGDGPRGLGCDVIAPIVPAQNRTTHLVPKLKADGWLITLGEALCPRCSAEEHAMAKAVGA
jgi:hypothetical protein